jgi:hypothetical protein
MGDQLAIDLNNWGRGKRRDGYHVSWKPAAHLGACMLPTSERARMLGLNSPYLPPIVHPIQSDLYTQGLICTHTYTQYHAHCETTTFSLYCLKGFPVILSRISLGEKLRPTSCSSVSNPQRDKKIKSLLESKKLKDRNIILLYFYVKHTIFAN